MLTRSLLYLVFFIVLIREGIAYADNVFIIKENGLSSDKERLINFFGDKVESELPRYTIKYLSPQKASLLNGSDNIIIALGEQALTAVVYGKGNSPVIGAFISRASYKKVTQSVSINRSNTAVYSDPSPFRQIALVKTLLGKGASAGVISYSSVQDDVSDAVKAAKALGVRLKVVELGKFTKPKSLVESFRDTRTLLLQKNKDIFQAIPLDTLLLLAYDINNLGIIGYSSGVVKNGALATTYTSLDDTVKSVVSLTKHIQQTGQVPSADYSEYYSVSVNKYVMRSLELLEKDNNEVKKSVSQLLREIK